MKTILGKLFSCQTIIAFIFFSLIISCIYVVIAMILAPTVALEGDVFIKVKSDYVLMLIQCIFGIGAMLLPGLLQKKLSFSIPSTMLIMYAFFIHCSIYLGEIRAFYYHVPHWDTILHTFSGAMLGALGFSIITILNKSDQIQMDLNPILVAIFAFCFAVTLGVFWEIYEFAVDIIFGTNMQKYALENKELLVGTAALRDTMKDLIVDCIGAFMMSLFGFISLKYEKDWLKSILLTFNQTEEQEKLGTPL